MIDITKQIIDGRDDKNKEKNNNNNNFIRSLLLDIFKHVKNLIKSGVDLCLPSVHSVKTLTLH